MSGKIMFTVEFAPEIRGKAALVGVVDCYVPGASGKDEFPLKLGAYLVPACDDAGVVGYSHLGWHFTGCIELHNRRWLVVSIATFISPLWRPNSDDEIARDSNVWKEEKHVPVQRSRVVSRELKTNSIRERTGGPNTLLKLPSVTICPDCTHSRPFGFEGSSSDQYR